MNWALATVKPNTETSVARALEQRGLPFHIFRYRAKVVRLKRVTTILRPLFPRYVFVPFDLAWAACRIDNVQGLVAFGEQVAAISHILVQGLVQSGVDDIIEVRDEAAITSPKYRPGDRIVAIVGVCVGRVGIVKRPLASGRIRVEFEFAGKRVVADLPPLELRLVERAVAKKRKRRYRRIIAEDAAA